MASSGRLKSLVDLRFVRSGARRQHSDGVSLAHRSRCSHDPSPVATTTTLRSYLDHEVGCTSLIMFSEQVCED
jgi:hypothetical protein